MRLIDADSLRDKINNLPLKNFMARDVGKAYTNERNIIMMIDDEPTVDGGGDGDEKQG